MTLVNITKALLLNKDASIRLRATRLYNTAHPDPNDPLHKYGVDDGFGYIDKNGRGHRFIGYYTWKYWNYVIE